jgi:acyl carrier protein
MDNHDGALKEQIKALLVQCARLKVPASSIADDTLLFDPEKGLGLDSIDVLELVVNLERSFGVTIQDRETGHRVLASVNTIADFIKASGKNP